MLRREVIRPDESPVPVELDRSGERARSCGRRDRPARGGVLLLVVGILLELVVVCLVKDFELFLNRRPERLKRRSDIWKLVDGQGVKTRAIATNLFRPQTAHPHECFC